MLVAREKIELNNPSSITTLGKLLETINCYEGDAYLYLKRDDFPWTRESLCLVVSPPEGIDPAEFAPIAASDLGLSSTLSISDINSIVENAQSQNSAIEIPMLVECLNYYWEFDAYLSL